MSKDEGNAHLKAGRLAEAIASYTSALGAPSLSKEAVAALHANRSTLLWFGGHSGHGDARTRLFRLHSGRDGFALLDTLRSSERRDAINMSLSSAFCWVPRGQGQGDPTRHMVAAFHGCVPVFSLGPSRDADDALPFDELLAWRRFSLSVPTDKLESLSLIHI